ncbi:MAG: chorismate mutase [Chloroflexi bacterium]|nr:chorismate mutase [Chloroflexota bacterium]
MPVRGIRGATVAADNTKEDILAATRELLLDMIAANDIQPEDIASAWFTTSPDLNAEFPAPAARALGWADVAILCGHEMNVPHGLKKCIRVLVHLNTDRPAHAIKHVYLGEAANLRPDRTLPVEIAK